ncbi:MAG: CYTH domain-containing protein [Anaerolineae bacterium]|nr:CYTH domain-containing protein [Anaerolineae bacterium]
MRRFHLAMEVEAKYIVPDPDAVRRLGRIERIDRFKLSAPTRYVAQDTFFDTRANDLVGSRHVLRLRRRSDGRALLTFKAPAEKSGAIHQRPETEVEVSFARTPRVLSVGALPRRVRKLVAPLVRSDDLYPLFSISQRRIVRNVRDGRKTIGEWSLDHVRFRAGERKHEFYELEIELKKTGTDNELSIIADWIEHELGLEAQTESKFKRALDFWQMNI